MAKASKKTNSKAIDEIDAELDKAVNLEEPVTVGLEKDIEFELDTDDLEARIAEISEDIMSNTNSGDEVSLPSERVAAAAEDLDISSTASQALPLPANDEHNSEINSLLYSISNKPRSFVFPLATIFTLVWLAGCAYVGYNTIYDTLPSTFNIPSIISNQPLLIFAAIVFVSLIVIWSCAILVKRSHDMKYSTNLMLSAAKQLLQPESIAIDSVTSVGTAVRREVAAIGEGVERAIARAGELEYMIQNEVMNIERSYGDSETKLRRLVEEISSEREEIVVHADKLQEAINKTHTNLASELETTATRIDETVRSSTDKQAKEMAESVVSAGQVVAKLLETRTASFQKASVAIEEKLDAGKQAFEQSIDTKTTDLSSILANAGQSVSSILNSGTANIADKSTELIDSIDVVQQKMVDEFVRQGENTTKNLEDSLSIRALEFGERIADSGDIIQTSIGNKLTQIDNSMTTIGEKLVSSLGMRAEELDKLLADRSTQIDETLNLRLSNFDETLVGHVDTTVGKLEVSTNALLENTKQAEEIISLRSKSVEDTLKKSTVEFANSVGKNIDTIQSTATDMDNKLSISAEQISATVNEGTQNLENILTSQSDTISSSMSQGAQNISEAMTSQNAILNEKLSESGEAIANTLIGHNSNLQAQFAEEKQALQNLLNSSTSRFDNALSSLKATAEENNTNITDILNSSTADISAALNNSLSAVEKQFTAGSQILENNLEKGKSNLLGTISKAVAESSKFIDNSAEGLSNTFSDRIGEMSSQLDYKTAQFNKLLSERANDLTNIIDHQAAPIAANLESVSSVISERLTDISETVSTNTTTLFNNLGDSRSVLEKLSEDTAFNLTTMRSNLMEQAEQFANLIHQSQEAMSTSTTLSENVYSKLKASSTNILEGMHEIAHRVEVQGNNLQEATRLIDHTQSNFEATVDSKQASLHELSATIANRSDELNNTVNSFGSVVNALVEQVGETSRTLSGTVTSDISSTIDDATARFNETVSSMRGAAVEMRKELEQTREEMRRGVLELPEETAQSADAMRKVVTDQISALKDLTKIIEDSGQMLDTKPASESIKPAITFAQPEPAAPIQAPSPAPVSRLPQAAPEPRIPTPKPAPVIAPSRPFPPAVEETADKRIPFKSTQPISPAPNAEATKEGNGWVSDLLRRASQEPEQNAPSNAKGTPISATPSLKNLSADIPNAIDNRVVSDLWTRYRDGENNLFSRNLYNLNGKLLFDQIAQNYTLNLEFKNGVDGYVKDFEDRLRQASDQGTSEQAIHAYLTSDQGKIYTMLAHAAGRYAS